MISVEDALRHVLALSAPSGPLTPEAVPLRRAVGRVLAIDAVARRDQPPFASAAMDGYAIRGADHVAGTRLRVVGEAAAGRAFVGQIGVGEAIRISTGAPVPDSADRVILQEDVTREDEIISLGQNLEPELHIRPAGGDFRVGTRVSAPRVLRANDLALLAAMNVGTVAVARRPVVAFIATGDELISAGENPGPAQIVASNTLALSAMAEAAGGQVRILPIARDSEDSLRFTFGLAEDADLIVTTGGASVGDHDLVGRVADAMGLERAFYQIAMRPGKPLMAGRLGRSILLGLPGNPVSSIVCGHLFMLPMLRAMQGLTDVRPRVSRALLAVDLPANGPRAHYMRARLLEPQGDTWMPAIDPFDRQDSSLLSILAEAQALLVRPVSDRPRRAGEIVDYIAI